MIQVGITGGIGSGKSFVCKRFNELFGTATYYADAKCKFLMENDPSLIYIIKNEFGDSSYKDGKINKIKFNLLLFNDCGLRMKMNYLVHPFIKIDYENWCKSLKGEKYTFFESAILFDNEELKIKTDFNIVVVADMDIRINRLVEREPGLPLSIIQARIKAQTSDDYKLQFADFVITNNGENLDSQILKINEELTNQAKIR